MASCWLRRVRAALSSAREGSRLAVHADWVGQGIGQGLLKDAVLRSLQACEQIGARALLCHAIDDAAKAFYAKHGFIKSPIHDMPLMLPHASRSSR